MCPNDNSACTKPLLPRRWDSLFDSEAGSDVIFIVGPEQWRFPGNRAVLADANSVFRAMLHGPLASVETTIPIEDVDGRAFDNLLRCVDGDSDRLGYYTMSAGKQLPTSLMCIFRVCQSVKMKLFLGTDGPSRWMQHTAPWQLFASQQGIMSQKMGTLQERANSVVSAACCMSGQQLYLYKEAVQLQSVPTALHTLYAAFKYQCGGLVKICVLYLDSKLDSSSVLEVYRHLRVYCDSTLSPQTAIQDDHSSSQQSSLSLSAPTLEHTFYRDHIQTITDGGCYFLPTNSEAITDALLYCNALKHNCLQYIDLHTKEVLEQEELEELDCEGLRLIALRETLTVPLESVLFDALVRWCNCECKRRRLELSAENKRAVLGEDTLYAVRYLLMSSEEFLAGPVQSGLLNPSEISEFLGYILHHPVPENPRLAKVIRRMQTPRSGPQGRPVSLSQRSNLEISDIAMSQSDGSQSGNMRLWGGKKCGKKDAKKQKKEKSKSISPERDGLEGQKRSFCSRFVEYFFSALSCLFD